MVWEKWWGKLKKLVGKSSFARLVRNSEKMCTFCTRVLHGVLQVFLHKVSTF